MRIALNGFGRIGRAFFKLALAEPNLEIVAVNDLTSIEDIIYLLYHDTVYGFYDHKIAYTASDPEQPFLNDLRFKNSKSLPASSFNVDGGKEIFYFQEKDPANLPWRELNIEIVIEATGVFEDFIKAKSHLGAGAKKVIITAPAKGEEGKDGRTVLLNINEEELLKFEVISNGSCTTNAVAPVLAILAERLGIKKALLNTVHAYTATQNLVDGTTKGKDLLRGRAAAQNIVPATTGAALAVTKVLKQLDQKFDGLAVRVPVVCGSLADLTFVSERVTTPEEINKILADASKEEKWKNILEVHYEPLVSSDIIKNTHPAIIDLSFTKVVAGDLCKVFVWYDNEWGYAWTLVEQLKRLQAIL